MVNEYEQKVAICNIPKPSPFVIASFLPSLYCLSMHSMKDFIAEFSPTNEKTVLICEIVCAHIVLYLFYNRGYFRDQSYPCRRHANHHFRICCSNHEEHRNYQECHHTHLPATHKGNKDSN
uniref:Uncharacterized protein n=1 Tax=Triticum urartu TaxID=4572 RepID=A0A8R7V785_TRIUA